MARGGAEEEAKERTEAESMSTPASAARRAAFAALASAAARAAAAALASAAARARRAFRAASVVRSGRLPRRVGFLRFSNSRFRTVPVARPPRKSRGIIHRLRRKRVSARVRGQVCICQRRKCRGARHEGGAQQAREPLHYGPVSTRKRKERTPFTGSGWRAFTTTTFGAASSGLSTGGGIAYRSWSRAERRATQHGVVVVPNQEYNKRARTHGPARGKGQESQKGNHRAHAAESWKAPFRLRRASKSVAGRAEDQPAAESERGTCAEAQ